MTSEVERVAIGIALGGTRITASLASKDGDGTVSVETIASIPVMVAFPDAAGPPVVGDEFQTHELSGHYCVSQIPNLLGKSAEHITKKLKKQGCTLPVVLKPNEELAEVKNSQPINSPKNVFLEVKGQEEVVYYSPEDLLTLVLKAMKQNIEKIVGIVVQSVVIALSPHFNDLERFTAKSAVQAAGFDVLRTTNRSTATCIAHKLDQFMEETNIMVFRLGSSLEIVVVSVEEGIFENKSIVFKEFSQDDFTVGEFVQDIASEDIAPSKFIQEDEKVKTSLSASQQTALEQRFDHETYSSRSITRKEIESIGAQFFEFLTKAIDEALLQARISKALTSHVVFVGGLCNIPKVQETVRKYFDQGTSSTPSFHAWTQSTEVVSHGAALLAEELTPSPIVGNYCFLYDLNVLSLGIEISGGLFLPIIKRNCLLPAKKVVTLTAEKDWQCSVLIRVFEGERARCSKKLSVWRTGARNSINHQGSNSD
eukprot:TRINITY_DN29499_c0_g1_i1.p1 TRINITY_DN29499_c0_g1~~TRINITY_DN29499_c0_g1_i1.p1  ORF type:complete len:482 (-),score=115.82 TRINITY_DN29499_c0_g1_i1:1561-3006(-)